MGMMPGNMSSGVGNKRKYRYGGHAGGYGGYYLGNGQGIDEKFAYHLMKNPDVSISYREKAGWGLSDVKQGNPFSRITGAK